MYKLLFVRMVLLGYFIVFSLVAFADSDIRKTRIDYYGHPLDVTINKSLITGCIDESNAESLYQTLKSLNRLPELDQLSNQLNKHARQLELDDMAYLFLIRKMNTSVFGNESENFRTLITYSLLYRKHIDMKLGKGRNGLTLYGRTNVLIDNCIFIQQGNKLFYDLSFEQNKEEQLEESIVLPTIEKPLPLVMNLIHSPKLNAIQGKKTIPFEYDGFIYFFSLKTNVSLTAYYNELPPFAIQSVYLNYGISDVLKTSLVSEFQKALTGRNTMEALDFILTFTQKAFEYRKDEDVYGKEKFAFADETVSSSFSDCEDKAILFATLVKELTGYSTVALYYKDARHINVAVALPPTNHSVSFEHNKQQYLICEPTVKGYKPGENSVPVSFARLIEW